MSARTEILDVLYKKLSRASELGLALNLELLSTSQLNELKLLTLTLCDALTLVGAYLEELEKPEPTNTIDPTKIEHTTHPLYPPEK